MKAAKNFLPEEDMVTKNHLFVVRKAKAFFSILDGHGGRKSKIPAILFVIGLLILLSYVL